MNEFNSRQRAEFARAVRNGHFDISDAGVYFPRQAVFIGGVFDVVHRRGGDVIGHDVSPNIVCTEGRNHILDAVVKGGTQVSTWYIGLFEGNYTPVAGVTAATVTAASTECTAYDEAARVAYVEGSISSGAVDNSASRAEFTINATKNVYGGFLVSNSTKSATTGTLLAIARFTSSPRAVVDDDVLAVRYDLSVTSS